MQRDYEIGMLWVEGSLTFVEALCAISFRDAGHHVRLYHYGPVQNVPAGIELVDGNEILKIDRFIKHGRTGSFALFSDVFRYHMLQQRENCIWADLDAYCVQPFKSDTGHYFGWESANHINGGVLGLPRDSEALGQLLDMTKDEYGIPEWYPDAEKKNLAALRDAGKPVHVSEMDWGVWGPHAVTHYLQKTGEAKYAFDRHVLYPIPFKDRRKTTQARTYDIMSSMIRDDTASIHFYGRRIKRFIGNNGGLPEDGSLMDELLKKHHIKPEPIPKPTPLEAPVKKAKPPTPSQEGAGGTAEQTVSSPRVFRPNDLTTLADRHGSDKGSQKHRYTELYHMLFNPFRRRKITFLEMGLLVGGPEQGKDASRKTDEPPSVKMWLDYFPNARIHGADISDFSWFKHDRFTFHQCDMDDRANIKSMIGNIAPAPMIVLDDASHASHHQQNAFLEIFPRMESGGLYVIEDLRWQPETYEKPGITKTAALFRSWLNGREFQHSDPRVAQEFNALADEISGCIIEPVRFEKKRRDQVAVIQKK